MYINIAVKFFIRLMCCKSLKFYNSRNNIQILKNHDKNLNYEFNIRYKNKFKLNV